VPPKIREPIADLEAAGFENRGGKGSHRNFRHPKLPRRVTVSVKLGKDAQPHQAKDVRDAIAEVTNERK
jgi:predicted RNA binding protein YcfA (HicA-like mRNA interferase family)